jgi:transposase-like protein
MSMKTLPQTAAPLSPPDPEVSDRPQRRTFSVADKLRILDEIDRARPGDLGAILRREGLYSSKVGRWRRQRDAGMLRGLAPAKPGPKSPPVTPLKSDIERLERENARLRDQLTRAEAVIELQKKSGSAVGDVARLNGSRREPVMEAIEQAAPAVDVATAGRALGVPRASFYRYRDRQRRVGPPCPPAPAVSRPRAEHTGTPTGARPAAWRALYRCRPGPGLRHAA